MKSVFLNKAIKYILLPLAALLVLSYIVYLVLNPINTVYNVLAVTEKAKCQIMDVANTSFNVEKVTIYDQSDSILFKDFSGNFRFYQPASIEFERISKGPLIISINNASSEPYCGIYQNETQIYKVNQSITIVASDIEGILSEGKSILIPISGKVECGEDLAGQVEGILSPVLREGTVTMAGYSKMSSSYYKAGSEQLYMGDRLVFDNDTTMAIGFIQVSEEPAFKIAYRVQANNAKVLKPGPREVNSGYNINVSIYDRLLNDKFFQSISLVFAGLAVIASIGSFIMDYLKFNDD